MASLCGRIAAARCMGPKGLGAYGAKNLLAKFMPSLAASASLSTASGRCQHNYLTHRCQHPLTLSSNSFNIFQRRSFWGVDTAFNKVDEERVRLAGPDRAAAEWVLRNGGRIRWVGSDRQLRDYNNLPRTDFDTFKIEEIDLIGSDVTDMGFHHLENLKHLKILRLHGVKTIADNSLLRLDYVTEVLEHLEISECAGITEKGLAYLPKHKNLKKVIIYNLLEVKDLSKEVSRLKEAMPWCQFETSDPLKYQKNR